MPTRGSGQRALTAPAVALVLGLALAGCTGDSAATPTPTPTVSPSTSPTPTPSPTPETPQPPVRPEAMATNDEAGAVAAAQYFVVDLYNYAHASLDTAGWRAMSDAGCNFCNSVATDVEALAEPVQFDIGATQVTSATGTTITDGQRYTATILAVQPQDARGSTTATYEFHFAIAWNQDWRILAVDVTPVA